MAKQRVRNGSMNNLNGDTGTRHKIRNSGPRPKKKQNVGFTGSMRKRNHFGEGQEDRKAGQTWERRKHTFPKLEKE